MILDTFSNFSDSKFYDSPQREKQILLQKNLFYFWCAL